MIYGPAFYKLLGIPESVAEPTAYHLLRVHPRAVTPARVEQALRQQKARLRQNIPGPQFIPVVAQIEQELDRAAALLKDPAKREQYNRQLLRKSGKGQRRGIRDRARLVAACRKAVRETVDISGCLADERRPELAKRLADLGLPDEQVRYVVENIPQPAGRPAASGEETAPALDDEAVEFFRQAVDLEIDNGVLPAEGEQKLLKMAERFGIDADEAAKAIDGRLAERAAERSDKPRPSVAGQFKLQLLAMFPLGDATEADRKRLLSLAAAEGIPRREAEAIVEEYLPGPDAGGGIDELGYPVDEPGWSDLEGLAEGQTASTPRRRRKGGRTLGRWAIDLTVGLVVAAMAITAYQLVAPQFRSKPPPAGTRSDEDARDGRPAGPRRPEGPRPAELLLVRAFQVVREGEALRKLFDEAAPAVRDETLQQAAELLMTGETVREQVRAEWLLRGLLSCPPSPPDVQQAAMDALVRRLGSATATGRLKDRRAYRPAALLASVLFLRPTPGFTVTEPEQMTRFLAECGQAWTQSKADRPADPANDPQRLAAAVRGGGTLGLYVERSDPERFSAVARELARAAADPAEPGSQAAFDALLVAAGRTRQPRGIHDAVRLALCDVLENAQGPFVAAKAQATLASVLALPFDHGLRGAPLGTAEGRSSAAAGFRRLIGARPETRPTPVVAATRPAASPASKPARRDDTLAQRVRDTWTDGRDTRLLLTDLACTTLACSARVARFAARSDTLSRELLSALGEKDAGLRAVRLTRGVELPRLDGILAVGGATTLDKELADRLARDLRSNAPGVRMRAIERLRVLDGPAAADILIARLREITTSAQQEYAEMNRILRALVNLDDRRLPVKLAEQIEPARANYYAHRIVMTLMDGTGFSGSTDRARYELPVNHNTRDRARAAQLWKALAASRPWGPRRLAGQIAGFAGPRAAWKPDEVTQKLLAAVVHQLDLTARMLEAYKPADPADAPAPPTLGPGREIKAPVGHAELTESLDRLVAQLTRLARAHENARAFAVKLDMIALTDKARALACETALQAAAVRLDTVGKLLETLVLEADGEGGKKDAVASSRKERQAAVGRADHVLVEMREHSYHNLILLGLLPAGGP